MILQIHFNNYFTNIGLHKGLNTKVAKIQLLFKYKCKFYTYFWTYWRRNCEENYKQPSHKNSCGFDGISAKLLKVIEPVILKSLTLLINQVLYSGIFPDKLKIAKVIPIFKKDDPSLFENYRPISLLPTIPKVLEKQNLFLYNYIHISTKIIF